MTQARIVLVHVEDLAKQWVQGSHPRTFRYQIGKFLVRRIEDAEAEGRGADEILKDIVNSVNATDELFTELRNVINGKAAR